MSSTSAGSWRSGFTGVWRGLIYPFLAAGLLLVANSGYGYLCFRMVEY
ncbi:MAG: hypothetical protein AB1715_08335 [Acidobacteriota bacterium]